MRISQVTIKNFKSYKIQTTIPLTNFTCITGLNGTGKSNILDAILFCLCTDGPKALRVSKFDELLNDKSEDAFVEVVIENFDPNGCYANEDVIGNSESDDHIQINSNENNKSNTVNDNFVDKNISNTTLVVKRVITKNATKSFLNKKPTTTSTLKKILPPILRIQQGTIQNSLQNNLKDFVMETARINLLHKEKENLENVIEKKEMKFIEVREKLKRTIGPFLEKLKEEKRGIDFHMEWKVDCQNMDKILEIHEIDDFIDFNKDNSDNNDSINKNFVDENDEQKITGIKKLDNIKTTLATKLKLLNSLLTKNERNKILNELKDHLCNYKEMNEELQKMNFEEEEIMDDDFGKDEKMKEIEVLKIRINELTKSLEENEAFDSDSSNFYDDENSTNENVKNLNNKRKSKNNVVKRTKPILSLAERLNNLTAELSNLKEKEKYLTQEIHNKKMEELGMRNVNDKIINIEKLRKRKGEIEYEILGCKSDGIMNIVNEIEKIIQNVLQNEIQNETLNIVDDLLKTVKEVKQNLNLKITTKEIFLPNYEHELSNLLNKQQNFTYQPMDGVFGTVQENYTIKPEYLQKNKSSTNSIEDIIDLILGNKKSYIITDNENTATTLINNAKKRLNVIPLNKIRPKKRNNKYKSLIDFIDFKDEVKNAIEYCFGNFYVFEKNEDANEACFKDGILCVSMEGNVYDPRGIVSGGTHSSFHKNNPKKGNNKNSKYENNDNVDNNENGYLTMKEMIDINNRISILNVIQKISQNIGSKILQVNTLIKNHNRLVILTEEKNHILNQLAMHGTQSDPEELKRVTNKIADLNKKIAKLNNKVNSKKIREERNQSIQKEKEDLITKIKNLEENVKEIDEKIRVNLVKRERMSFFLKEKSVFEGRKIFLMKETGKLGNKIRKIFREHEDVIKLISDCSNITTNENLLHFEKECQNDTNNKDIDGFSNLTIENLHGIYGFLLNINFVCLSDSEENSIKEDLQKTKNYLSSVPKKITMDPKNFEFLEKNEEKIEFLTQKIKKIEIDKKNLQKKIRIIEKKTEEEMKKASEFLNKNVGKFIGYFLKNTQIKINNSFDIEITMEKEKKIGELSGGQKSVIALSLIFGMLKYRPAFFYLFDEVDSALDLSFTMKMGEVFKEFQAQFVCVSLKEEFYNSAESVLGVYAKEGVTKVKRIK